MWLWALGVYVLYCVFLRGQGMRVFRLQKREAICVLAGVNKRTSI